jgi:uncharacterized membrane protein
MKRVNEENTVSVLQRAIKHLRIHVTAGAVKEALKAHPHYPSFKSICDVLNEWNIENYPLKYQPEELKDISPPYLVHFNHGGGQLAFVTKVGKEFVTYYNSYDNKRSAKFDEFISKCSGAVIILNPDKGSGDKDYRNKRQGEIISNAILPVTVLAFIIFIILILAKSFASGSILFDSMISILFLTKTAGIVLSVLLILHEFEVRLSLTEKLCHLNKATNCNTVLNDKASKVFGWFGWADIGFIYFTAGLIFLLQDFKGEGLSIIAILAALSIPYPLFSIYYQGFVLKKWCPLCLGVQFILILEFLLLIPQLLHFKYSFIAFLGLVLTFLVIGIVYILFILYQREKVSRENYYYKYLRFKKNPDILKTLLLKNKHYDIPVTEYSLVYGDKDSSLQITAFLSLHCSHCAKAFEKIKEIIKSEYKAAINIVLVAKDNKIIDALYHFKNLKKEDEALGLLDKWFNADPYSRNRLADDLCIPDIDDVANEFSNENKKLYETCNVSGTPTFFVNGYKLPVQYDIDDIKSFSEIFFKEEKLLV